jgi:hypothetical protein
MDRSMNRRRAIRNLATGTAGAVTSLTWAESLTALARQHARAQTQGAAIAASAWSPTVLTGGQNDTVVVLTELIIPETDTPGAKAALVNRFIDGVLARAEPPLRQRFADGLAWLDRRSTALYGRPFAGASANEQADLLTRLSAEGNPHKEEQAGRDFFEAVKGMTINGYYTTEIGLRQELGDNGQLFLVQFEGCTHAEHE